MTRKDYVAIAQAFRRAEVTDSPEFYWERQAWARCRNQVADVLAADNPRFDRVRFVAACTVSK